MRNRNEVQGSMGETKRVDKIWDAAIKAMVPLGILLAGTIIGHELRITRIEETRFTMKDSLEMGASIKSYVDTSFPQPWLRESIGRIEKAVETNNQKLDVLTERVIRLER